MHIFQLTVLNLYIKPVVYCSAYYTNVFVLNMNLLIEHFSILYCGSLCNKGAAYMPLFTRSGWFTRADY